MLARLLPAILGTFLSLFAVACDIAVDGLAPSGSPSPVKQPSATNASAIPGVHCAPPYPTGPPSVETVFCADPAALESSPVLRIVDGDTIHVEVDGRDETVRFYGIDTPERGDACFSEATERTRELAGSRVLLRPDAREGDRYDRSCVMSIRRTVSASMPCSLARGLLSPGETTEPCVTRS